MAHTIHDQKRINARINRLKGQLGKVSESIEAGKDCYEVLQLLASCRGALNGLMGDILEGHIREHIVSATNKQEATKSGEELIEVMKSFWK